LYFYNVFLKIFEILEHLRKILVFRMSLLCLGEWKEPFGGEKVGSLGRVVSPRELMVVSLKMKISPRETMQLGIMMFPRIGCSIVKRGEWGFLGSIGVAFLVKGGGRVLGNSVFPRAGCGSLEEVGVPNGRCGVGLKNKKGVRASGLGVGLWGCRAN
jgi:hypothetical protein